MVGLLGLINSWTCFHNVYICQIVEKYTKIDTGVVLLKLSNITLDFWQIFTDISQG